MVGGTRVLPQRFRVMVIRYPGEMDFTIDNSFNNGFELQNQTSHIPKVGQSWEDLPYVRNQIQVLYDRTFTIQETAQMQEGIGCSVNVNIKKKMTFESTSSGHAAVGAGNVYLAINSDRDFTVNSYILTALYKQV